MSAFRRMPVTDKEYTFVEIDKYKCCTCTMQGWRKNMEDNYIKSILPSGIIMVMK